MTLLKRQELFINLAEHIGTNQHFKLDENRKENKYLESSFESRLGKCYELSWQYINYSDGRKEDIQLVHGYLTARGKTIDHAWIEENGEVFDPVLNQRFKREQYYSLYNIEPIKFYTYEEAIENAETYRVYGPWHRVKTDSTKKWWFESKMKRIKKMKVIEIVDKEVRINEDTILEIGDKIQLISEGINDKNILKAVFLAGGPGSGKSFIAENMFGTKRGISPFGVKVINSDYFFELGLKKEKLPPFIVETGSEIYDKQMMIRAGAKAKVELKKGMHIDSLLPIIIDGTGKDLKKLTSQAGYLESKGYDVSMVFINTSLEVALARNNERARTVQPELVKKMWLEVQTNIGAFNKFFTENNRQFLVIDNNNQLKKDTPESKAFLAFLWKAGARMINRPLKSRLGLSYIKFLKLSGGKYMSDLSEKIRNNEEKRGDEKRNDRN